MATSAVESEAVIREKLVDQQKSPHSGHSQVVNYTLLTGWNVPIGDINALLCDGS